MAGKTRRSRAQGRKPNPPGAGVTFDNFQTADDRTDLPETTFSQGSFTASTDVLSVQMHSYYDGDVSPHAMDGFFSGHARDAIAGTIEVSRELTESFLTEVFDSGFYFDGIEYDSDLARLIAKFLSEFAVGSSKTKLFGGTARLRLTSDRARYGGGYSRRSLDKGDGPNVDCSLEVSFDEIAVEISNFHLSQFVASLPDYAEEFRNYLEGVLNAVETVASKRPRKDRYVEFRVGTVYTNELEVEGSFCASEITAEIYSTLDSPIYSIFTDDCGFGPYFSREEADNEFDNLVKSQDYQYVELHYVDRDLDAHEKPIRRWRAESDEEEE